MIPDFAGDKVIRVMHRYAVWLWTDSNWEFRLAGRVLLTAASGVREIDNRNAPTEDSIETVDALLGARIKGVLVSASGDLAIQFEKAQLSCSADPVYEAWELSGPVGEKIVCSPGGELEVWGPRAE